MGSVETWTPDEPAVTTHGDAAETDARQDRQIKMSIYSKLFFNIGNILLALAFIIISVLISANVFSVHMVNVTEYCNSPEYFKNVTPQHAGSFEYIIIGLVFAPSVTVVIMEAYIEGFDTKKILKHILETAWTILVHLLVLYIFIYFIKFSCGEPTPYFFSREETRTYYCGDSALSTTKIRSPLLVNEEYELRTSFPSFRSAVYGFCITFLCLYVDYFDWRAHLIQQVLILAVGSQISGRMFNLWESGEHHLKDILVGATIGIMGGVLLIRNMLGSVFRSMY